MQTIRVVSGRRRSSRVSPQRKAIICASKTLNWDQ
jgi:hypothetical protein